MKANNKGRRSFRSKLVFSYIIVTIATAITLEAILIAKSAFDAVVYLQNPDLLVTDARKVAKDIAGYLDAPLSVRQKAELSNMLKDIAGTPVVVPNPDVPYALYITVVAPPWVSISVIDSDGRVIASEPESEWQVGQPVAGQLRGSELRVYTKSVDGKSSTVVQTYGHNGKCITAAVPVRSSSGQQTGTLFVRYIIPFDAWSMICGIMVFTLPNIAMLGVFAGMVAMIFGYVMSRHFMTRINRLLSAAESWKCGDFDVNAGDNGKDELGQLAANLDIMASTLKRHIAAQETIAIGRERNRLAAELHDTVKQQAFAATMQIGAAQAALEKNTADAGKYLAEAATLTRAIQSNLATLLLELRDSDMPWQGLEKVLNDYAADWSRQTGIQTELRFDGDLQVSPRTGNALMRIATGALSNTARHSGASLVKVHTVTGNGTVRIRIEDNGNGFDTNSVRMSGVGLSIMQERVSTLAGGWLDVTSTPGHGTIVETGCNTE